MGTIFRTVTGLVIALTLLQGTGFWTALKTHSVYQVKADIEAAHPGARLEASLSTLLAPQKDTKSRPYAREIQARGLQF